MVWEIYAYGNVEILTMILNGIALLMGSGDYAGLIRTIVLVAMFSVFIGALGARHFDGFKWALAVVLFYSIIFVPKVNVAVVDRLALSPPTTIQNVPIGFAVFGHLTSKIGDWLARSFEAVYTLPANLQYTKSGMLFGHRVMDVSRNALVANGDLARNLNSFYRDCTYYDLYEGRINPAAMRRAPIGGSDAWWEMRNTNPGRLTSYNGVTTWCNDAYAQLTSDFAAEIPVVLDRTADGEHPKLLPAVARAQWRTELTDTYSTMLNVSASAEQITRQNLVLNTLNDAAIVDAVEHGDPASAINNWALAQARTQQRTAFATGANLARETLPILRNVIEVVLYALFPFVFLLFLMPVNTALMAMKSYVMSLTWVQLWAPCYAVLNLVMTYRGQESWPDLTEGIGVAFDTLGKVSNLVIGEQDVAGYMVTAIPVIAYMAVMGMGAMMSSVASGFTQSTQGAAGSAATGAASGNLSMSTVSYATTAHHTAQGNKFDESHSWTEPQMSRQTNEFGTRITGSSGYAAFQQQGSQLPQRATITSEDAQRFSSVAEKEYGAGLREVNRAMHERSRDNQSGTDYSHDRSAAGKRLYEAQTAVERVFGEKMSKQDAKREATNFIYRGGLEVGVAKGDKSGKGGSEEKRGVSGRASLGGDAQHTNIKQEEWSVLHDYARRALRKQGFSSSDEIAEAVRETDTYRELVRAGDSHVRGAEAHFARSQEWEQRAEDTRSLTASGAVDLTNAYVAELLRFGGRPSLDRAVANPANPESLEVLGRVISEARDGRSLDRPFTPDTNAAHAAKMHFGNLGREALITARGKGWKPIAAPDASTKTEVAEHIPDQNGVLKEKELRNDLASAGQRNPIAGEFRRIKTAADNAANEADAETEKIRLYGTGIGATIRRIFGNAKTNAASEKPEGKWK